MVASLVFVQGCMQRTNTYLVFDGGSSKEEQTTRAMKECEYEALKATAGAKPGIGRAIDQEEILIRCMGLKGFPYKGEKKVPVG
jgi:hypothetical protein